MDQVFVKYTNIFHCKTIQNLPTFGSLVWKQTIWQPWSGAEHQFKWWLYPPSRQKQFIALDVVAHKICTCAKMHRLRRTMSFLDSRSTDSGTCPRRHVSYIRFPMSLCSRFRQTVSDKTYRLKPYLVELKFVNNFKSGFKIPLNPRLVSEIWKKILNYNLKGLKIQD
jgi:hypothetical protein